VCLCVLCGSENKQRLFHYTTLTNSSFLFSDTGTEFFSIIEINVPSRLWKYPFLNTALASTFLIDFFVLFLSPSSKYPHVTRCSCIFRTLSTSLTLRSVLWRQRRLMNRQLAVWMFRLPWRYGLPVHCFWSKVDVRLINPTCIKYFYHTFATVQLVSPSKWPRCIVPFSWRYIGIREESLMMAPWCVETCGRYSNVW